MPVTAPRRDEVDAIVYDFGGVLVAIDFDRVFARWARHAGVPMEMVKSRFTHGGAYSRHERGDLPIEGYWAALREQLGIDISDAQFAEGWERVFGEEYPNTLELVSRLRGRVPQYMLSNTNPTHLEFMQRRYADVFARLDGIFTSCGLGSRKPERASFEAVAREIGVPLERILFFDDTESNVEGAREVGMKAVLVRSEDDVACTLNPWLT